MRNNPARVLISEQLNAIDEIASAHGQAAANKFLAATKEGLQESLKGLYGRASQLLADFPAWAKREFARMAREKLDSLPALKGDPGYTPVKGKDYFDGPPGKTPVPNVDYPTVESVTKMIGAAHVALYDKLEKEGLSATQIKAAIGSAFDTIPAEKIARAMEKLPLKEKLDYNKGLKNQPSELATAPHTLHRGTSSGKQTYYYDLSDLCDGNTKVFVIPSNTRVVSVVGTDAPSGVYRPLVDWTGTGTITLTLTSAVAAPTLGATLYILYVV